MNTAHRENPTLSDLTHVFGRIGLLSFGGPAAQIALMHKELVEDRSWLTEAAFLRALSFCMLLPGPEAMQLATYAGWRQRGIAGGLIAGGLFVLPGALVIFAMALLYGHYGSLNWVQSVFLGVQATVVIIVIEALLRVARKALLTWLHKSIAILAFVALYVFGLPFPLVIFVAALIGAVFLANGDAETDVGPGGNLKQSALILFIGIALWGAPIAVVMVSDATFLTDLALFFSKLAVVTFGGAYAVLAYMTQEVVADFGWLATAQMMDALGLAETTPGPLILVTQFVGMLAGLSQGGTGLAIVAGLLTLWVTFVPCFVWIFAGAPLIDWLATQPRLRGALAAITAAVVGVIANLSLWFAVHVFFGDTTALHSGLAQFVIPVWSTFVPVAFALAALAAVLLMRFKLGLPLVLTLTGCAALAFGQIGWIA